jgi:hypothetical protein
MLIMLLLVAEQRNQAWPDIFCGRIGQINFNASAFTMASFPCFILLAC